MLFRFVKIGVLESSDRFVVRSLFVIYSDLHICIWQSMFSRSVKMGVVMISDSHILN